jgi:hypothetical protein
MQLLQDVREVEVYQLQALMDSPNISQDVMLADSACRLLSCMLSCMLSCARQQLSPGYQAANLIIQPLRALQQVQVSTTQQYIVVAEHTSIWVLFAGHLISWEQQQAKWAAGFQRNQLSLSMKLKRLLLVVFRFPLLPNNKGTSLSHPDQDQATSSWTSPSPSLHNQTAAERLLYH